MNFSEKLKAWQDQVNRAMDQALPGSEVHPTRLHQAIRHSVDAGGKAPEAHSDAWGGGPLPRGERSDACGPGDRIDPHLQPDS